MATKYIARLDGKIVGKRKTENRTYTHAIVTQRNEVAARQFAYGYVATKSDRSNFDYYCAEAVKPRHEWRTGETLAAYMADCQAKVAGGFDAYVERVRRLEIERFEQALKKGAFEPQAVSWAGRPDLAQKEAAKRNSYYAKVWIVPAEVV
jgi:hypothetical protein